MKRHTSKFKYTFVTVACLCAAFPVFSQGFADDLTELYRDLRDADSTVSDKLAAEIRFRWKTSGSQTVDLLVTRGTDALARRDAVAASEHLTAAIGFAPEFATAYLERAKSYVMLDMLGPAVADLKSALDLDPNYFDAIAVLGQVFERLGEFELALLTYEQALALYPHFTEVQSAYDALNQAHGDTAL
jgi:Tfp pilus assembly protein PilF